MSEDTYAALPGTHCSKIIRYREYNVCDLNSGGLGSLVGGVWSVVAR